MAQGKKSFVLYCDLIHIIDKMPDDKAGLLFKHLLSYVNDKNPETDDLIVSLTFEPIKLQMKRDLKKYENVCERNRNNGALGGRPPKTQITQLDILGLKNNPKKPKKPDTDTDTDTDINILFSVFWNLYDKKIAAKDCESKWKKLTDAERTKIIDTLPNFLNSIQDKQFLPHPATYLNQKRWNDEVKLIEQKSEINKPYGGLSF